MSVTVSTLLVCIVAFLFGLFGSIPPAGPIAVIVISRAFERRYREAFRVGLGAALAEGVYAFLAFWGFAMFLSHEEIIRPISHAVTAVVMLAWGVRFLFWKERAPAGNEPQAAGFVVGLSTAALNPVLLVTWSAAVAALYARPFVRLEPTMALPFALAAALGVAMWVFLMVALLRRYGERFRHAALARIVQGMGLTLIGLAIWSAVELVRYRRPEVESRRPALYMGRHFNADRRFPPPSLPSVSVAPPRLLGARGVGICFGVSMLVFLFGAGPVWRHPWDVDGVVLASYAVIPALVALYLAGRGRLGWLGFSLGTLEVTLYKFGATYLLAHAMWMLSSPPPKAAPREPPHPATAAADSPLRAVDAANTGTIEGRVTSARGAALADAVGFIDGGLQSFAFQVPTEPLRVVDTEGAITVSSRWVQLGQRVEARSGDRKLHTLVAASDEGDAFSIPLQSSGAPSSAMATRGAGALVLHCAVHPHSSETARLIVAPSPFAILTGLEGRFRWTGVPAGSLRISVATADDRRATKETAVRAGETSTVDLAL